MRKSETRISGSQLITVTTFASLLMYIEAITKKTGMPRAEVAKARKELASSNLERRIYTEIENITRDIDS